MSFVNIQMYLMQRFATNVIVTLLNFSARKSTDWSDDEALVMNMLSDRLTKIRYSFQDFYGISEV
jgi:hypothetical protein